MTSLCMKRQFWRSDVTRGWLLQYWSWAVSRLYTRFFKQKIDKMYRLRVTCSALAISPDSGIPIMRSRPNSDGRGIFQRCYGAKFSICELSRYVCRLQKCALCVAVLSSLVPMLKKGSKWLLGYVTREWRHTRLKTCVTAAVYSTSVCTQHYPGHTCGSKVISQNNLRVTFVSQYR